MVPRLAGLSLSLSLVALSGCGSLSVRAACAQASRCGQLATGVTEASCSSGWNAELARLRALKRDTCTRYVRATEALFACRASLSCEQSADLLASLCAQQSEDWNVLDSVAAGECR
jgi:hypothetical protein